MPLYNNKTKSLTNYKMWAGPAVDMRNATETRKISEEWSVKIVDEQIVSLYHHHCKGTKGLVGQTLTHLGVVDGQQIRYAYGGCDLCGTRPDENTLTLIQLYNVRI